MRRKDKQKKLFAEEDEEDADLGASGPLIWKKKLPIRGCLRKLITPASRLIDMSIDHAGFHRQFGAVVLGIQRRARVVRRRLGRIRLEAGDVLLVAGSKADIEDMRYSQDLIVLSGSKKELPVPKKAPIAGFIMMATIGLAAFGILSIPVAAITGSVLMIATDCLNVRQATRAIDRKIFLLVGAMLALGQALQVTRGDEFIADSLLSISFVDTPFLMLSLLFIVVAICTNILSNNACAILFTPIAAGIAVNMGVDFIFALTVLFASNCSHHRLQTNLQCGAGAIVSVTLSGWCAANLYLVVCLYGAAEVLFRGIAFLLYGRVAWSASHRGDALANVRPLYMSCISFNTADGLLNRDLIS